jgi:hypothetical protein
MSAAIAFKRWFHGARDKLVRSTNASQADVSPHPRSRRALLGFSGENAKILDWLATLRHFDLDHMGIS